MQCDKKQTKNKDELEGMRDRVNTILESFSIEDLRERLQELEELASETRNIG